MIFTFVLFGAVIFGCCWSSCFEWNLHKHLMHTRRKCKQKWLERIVNYPFVSHAVIHHGDIGADESYHTSDPETQKKIPMAWWNGPVLVTAAASPIWAVIGILAIWLPFYWPVALTITLTIALYFCAYEYLHWCMHDPKGRWFEGTRLFRWIDDHHHGHHEKMHKNFNVVLPLMDLLTKTFYKWKPRH